MRKVSVLGVPNVLLTEKREVPCWLFVVDITLFAAIFLSVTLSYGRLVCSSMKDPTSWRSSMELLSLNRLMD